jgi:hypothetical protein
MHILLHMMNCFWWIECAGLFDHVTSVRWHSVCRPYLQLENICCIDSVVGWECLRGCSKARGVDWPRRVLVARDTWVGKISSDLMSSSNAWSPSRNNVPYTMSSHRILVKAFHQDTSNSCLERLVRSLLTVTGYSSNTITPSHLIYLVEFPWKWMLMLWN